MTEQLGHYELLNRLGRGGAATVYRARDIRDDKTVALKVLLDADDTSSVQRFRREANMLRRLDHPHIVRFYELGSEEHKVFFALQYVDGQSLDVTLNECRRTGTSLAAHSIMSISMQMLSALHYIEGLSLFHRDLKPANILVDNEGQAYLSDFGLARFKDLTRLTKEGHTVGTMNYMSPEQMIALDVDHRSDLYQLGLIMYVMAFGRLPQLDDNAFESARKRAINGFPVPTTVPDGLDVGFSSLIAKACNTDPDERFQCAHEMAEAVASLATASAINLIPPEFRLPSPELVQSSAALEKTSVEAKKANTAASSTSTVRRRSTSRSQSSLALFFTGMFMGLICAFIVYVLAFGAPWLRPFAKARHLLATKKSIEALTAFETSLNELLLANNLDDDTRRQAIDVLSSLAPSIPVSHDGYKVTAQLLESLTGTVPLWGTAKDELGKLTVRLARYLIDGQERMAAIRLLGTARQAGAVSPSLLQLTGELALEDKRYDIARIALLEAVLGEPDNPRNLLLLGRAAQGSDRYQLALDCYRTILARQPRHSRALAEYVHLLFRSGSAPLHGTATQIINDESRWEQSRDEDRAFRTLWLGVSAAGRGETTKATNLLLESRSARATFEGERTLARLVTKSGEHHRALPYLKKAYELSPDHENTLHLLALEIYFQKLGTQPFNSALQKLATCSPVHEQWVQSLLHVNALGPSKDKNAISTIKAHVERWPCCIVGHLWLAAKLLLLGQFDAAESVLRRIERRVPSAPQLLYFLSRIYEEKKQLKKAISYGERAIRSAPRIEGMRKHYFKLASNVRDWGHEAKVIEYLATYNLHDPIVLANQAEAYARIGKLDEAIAIGRRLLSSSFAIDLNKTALATWQRSRGDIRARLCAKLFRAGRWKESFELVETLLKESRTVGTKAAHELTNRADISLINRMEKEVQLAHELVTAPQNDQSRWHYFGTVPPPQEETMHNVRQALAQELERYGDVSKAVQILIDSRRKLNGRR